MDISKILGAGGGAGGGQMGAFAANAMGGLGGFGGVRMMGPGGTGGNKPPGGAPGQENPYPNVNSIEDVFDGGTIPSLRYRFGGMAALTPFQQAVLQQRQQQQQLGAPQMQGPNPNAMSMMMPRGGGMPGGMPGGGPRGGIFGRM